MLKVLLGGVVIVMLLYVISGSAISSVVSLGAGADEEGGGPRLGSSPFPITFTDEYLCYSMDHEAWVMRGHDDDGECKGPFQDSISLCRAMAEEDLSRIGLFASGRVLECN